MKKIKGKIMIAAVLAATMLAASGCAAKTAVPAAATVPASASTTASKAVPTTSPLTTTPSTTTPAAQGWIITIEGAEKSPVEFNEAEAAKVGLIKQSASVKDKDTSLPAQEWEGVPLEKLLEYYGVKTYTTVRVESLDGTFKEYTPDLVASSKALLGLKADGQELDQDSGPVQLVVDGKGPNWWIRQVSQITVNK